MQGVTGKAVSGKNIAELPTMSTNVITITDLDLGNRSVTNDIENVLRKIEYWHQGSIATFRIMYRDSLGVWDGVH